MTCRRQALTLLPIPATHSASGIEEWKLKGVDYCLKAKVDEFNSTGQLTLTCCCGHGKVEGEILLQDGRRYPIPRCREHRK